MLAFPLLQGVCRSCLKAQQKPLVATAMDTDNIEPRQSYALAAEGDSRESLLVNWLSDVLYQIDGRRLALRRFKVHELDSGRVSGEAFGEPRRPERHPGRLIIEGITYYQLKVDQDRAGWFCEVYLDI
jgi:SHS2 domain-containing protein